MFNSKHLRNIGSTLALTGAVLSGACEKREPAAAGTSAPAAAAPSTSAIEQAVLGVATQVRALYARQSEKGSLPGGEAEEILLRLRKDLLRALPEKDTAHLINSPESPEAREAITRGYLKHGYYVNSGLVSSKHGNFVSLCIAKLGEASVPLPLTTFAVGGMTLQVSDKVQGRAIEAQLVEDYENVPGNRITGFESFVPGQYLPSVDLILLSPNHISEFALQSGLSSEDARSAVVLNECGHAAFENFLSSVPGAQNFTVLQDVPGGKTTAIGIPQVSEAFSDFITLKYGNGMEGFLEERGREAFDAYQFSDRLLSRGVANVLRANPPIVDTKGMDTSSFQAAARSLAVYVKVHPESKKVVQQMLIAAYEKPLGEILELIQKTGK